MMIYHFHFEQRSRRWFAGDLFALCDKIKLTLNSIPARPKPIERHNLIF
jgi:hypothetical protein